MTVKKYANGKWGYYFGHEGKRYRKQGFKTKREATEEETQAKNQLMQGKVINNKSSFIGYYTQWIVFLQSLNLFYLTLVLLQSCTSYD